MKPTKKYASKDFQVLHNSLKVGAIVFRWEDCYKIRSSAEEVRELQIRLSGLTASVIRANRLLPERKLHFTALSTNSLCNSSES